MKLINPSVKFLKPDYEADLKWHNKQIADAAHLCYKQENSKLPNEHFVESLIKRGHLSPLEHGTIYLTIKKFSNTEMVYKYEQNPYSKVVTKPISDENGKIIPTSFITTNYRVIVENHWEDDLQYLTAPTDNHVLRYGFHIVTDRATATQILRHRKLSFSMESQRYCNYSQDKFGNEVTFCMPHWYFSSVFSSDWTEAQKSVAFEKNMKAAEEAYFKNLEMGLAPEDARYVLPNQTKTELIVTGFEEDWKHFLDLRLKGTTGKPHPEVKKLAEEIEKYII